MMSIQRSVADDGRHVVVGGGVLQQQRPAVVPAGISQVLGLVGRQKAGQVGERVGMAHGRRGFGQLDLAGGGSDGAFQIAGLGCPACPIPGAAARGSERFSACRSCSSGGAAPGRIERLELASERGSRFQDHGDPEQRLAALDDEGVVLGRDQVELLGRDLKEPDLDSPASRMACKSASDTPCQSWRRSASLCEVPVLFVEPAQGFMRVQDGAGRGQGGFQAALRQRSGADPEAPRREGAITARAFSRRTFFSRHSWAGRTWAGTALRCRTPSWRSLLQRPAPCPRGG